MSTNTAISNNQEQRSELIQAGQNVLDMFRMRKSKLSQENDVQNVQIHTQESLVSQDNIEIFAPSDQKPVSPQVDIVPLNTPEFDHQHYSLPLNHPEDSIDTTNYGNDYQEQFMNPPFINSSTEALTILKETRDHLEESGFHSNIEYEDNAILEPLATWLQTHFKKNSTLSSISHHTFNLLFNDIHLLRSEFNSLLIEHQKLVQDHNQLIIEKDNLIQMQSIEHANPQDYQELSNQLLEQSRHNDTIHQQWIEWIENERKHLDSLAQEQQLDLQQQEKQQRLALLQETQTLERAKILLLQEQEAFQAEYSAWMQTQQDLESVKQSIQYDRDEFENDKSEFLSWKENELTTISNERDNLEQYKRSILSNSEQEREAIAKEHDQIAIANQSLMNERMNLENQIHSLDHDKRTFETEKNLFEEQKLDLENIKLSFERERMEWEQTKQSEWNSMMAINIKERDSIISSIDDCINSIDERGQSILVPLRQEYTELYHKVIELVDQVNSTELYNQHLYISLLDKLCQILNIDSSINNEEKSRQLIQTIVDLQDHVQRQDEYIIEQEKRHKEYIESKSENVNVNDAQNEQTWWERLKVLELAIRQLELERKAFEQEKENNIHLMNKMDNLCKTILSRLSSHESQNITLDNMMDMVNQYLLDDSFMFISPIKGSKAIEKKKNNEKVLRFDVQSTPFRDEDDDNDNGSSIFKTPMVRIRHESFAIDNESPNHYVDRGTDSHNILETSVDDLDKPSYISFEQQHCINELKDELDRVTISYKQSKDELERLYNAENERKLHFEKERKDFISELDKIRMEYNSLKETFDESAKENRNLANQVKIEKKKSIEAYDQKIQLKEIISNIANTMDNLFSRIEALKRERGTEIECIDNILKSCVEELISHDNEQPLLMNEDELIMEALSPRKITAQDDQKVEIFRSLKHSMMQHTMDYLFSPNASRNALPIDKQQYSEYDEKRAQEAIKKSEQTIEWLDNVKQAWSMDEEMMLTRDRDDQHSIFSLGDQEKQALTTCFVSFLKYELENSIYMLIQEVLRQVQNRLNKLTKSVISLRVSIKSLDAQNRTLEHALEQSLDQQIVGIEERYRIAYSNEADQRNNLEQKIVQLEREKESLQNDMNYWMEIAKNIKEQKEMINRTEKNQEDVAASLKTRIISLETMYRKYYLKSAYWKLRCKRELGYRSDLVYQKKYLLLTISGLEAKEHVALNFLSQHRTTVAQDDRISHIKDNSPEKQFRIHILSILAISRMRLLSHKTSTAMKSVLSWSPSIAQDTANTVNAFITESAIAVV